MASKRLPKFPQSLRNFTVSASTAVIPVILAHLGKLKALEVWTSKFECDKVERKEVRKLRTRRSSESRSMSPDTRMSRRTRRGRTTTIRRGGDRGDRRRARAGGPAGA